MKHTRTKATDIPKQVEDASAFMRFLEGPYQSVVDGSVPGMDSADKIEDYLNLK